MATLMVSSLAELSVSHPAADVAEARCLRPSETANKPTGLSSARPPLRNLWRPHRTASSRWNQLPGKKCDIRLAHRIMAEQILPCRVGDGAGRVAGIARYHRPTDDEQWPEETNNRTTGLPGPGL